MIKEFALVGLGPANIILLTHLLNKGVAPDDIVLIGDQIGGAFVNEYSQGSGVPGNTASCIYKAIYQQIYKQLPCLAPPTNRYFRLNNQNDNAVCTLDIPAEPLKYIAEKLCQLSTFYQERVSAITTSSHGLVLHLATQSLKAKQVILGIGGTPRNKNLPERYKHQITVIHPTTVFIYSELINYLNNTRPTVAVIGSSHSAALATMHLLLAGCKVIQFMNKEYNYAETVFVNGLTQKLYDDTGLKGSVAQFTRQLIADKAQKKGIYHARVTYYLGKDNAEIDYLLEKYLPRCTHSVSAIGYDPTNSIRVEGLPYPLTRQHYNHKTLQFFEGLFGNGLAFAEEVNGAQANGLEKYNATATWLANKLFCKYSPS